jgi:hypothetical protein
MDQIRRLAFAGPSSFSAQAGPSIRKGFPPGASRRGAKGKATTWNT